MYCSMAVVAFCFAEPSGSIHHEKPINSMDRKRILTQIRVVEKIVHASCVSALKISKLRTQLYEIEIVNIHLPRRGVRWRRKVLVWQRRNSCVLTVAASTEATMFATDH